MLNSLPTQIYIYTLCLEHKQLNRSILVTPGGLERVFIGGIIVVIDLVLQNVYCCYVY